MAAPACCARTQTLCAVIDGVRGASWSGRRNCPIRHARASALSGTHEGTLPDHPTTASEYLEHVGLRSDILAKAAYRNPSLRDLDVHRLEPVLHFFRQLGLSTADTQRMLLKCPEVFNYSLEHKIQPAMEFLDELGFSDAEKRSIILRFPQLLGYSTKGHLKPQLAYLISLGVPQTELPQLIVARPGVLGLSIDRVANYLARRKGIPRRQVGKLLATFPVEYRIPVFEAFPWEAKQGEQ